MAFFLLCVGAGDSTIGFTRNAHAQNDTAAAATEISAANEKIIALWTQGQQDEAYTFATQTYRRALSTLGEKHPVSVVTLNYLVTAMNRLGQGAQGLPLFERAVTLNRELIGETHGLTLAALNHYAAALVRAGRATDALPHYQRLIEGREKTLGARHLETLRTVNEYANVLQRLGRSAEALPHSERVLKGRLETLGEKDPATLTSMSNLSVVLEAVGRLGEALAYAERALTLTVEVRGENHFDTYLSMNNYAAALARAGHYAQALAQIERALQLSTRHSGEKHPNTLNTLANYAVLLRSAGDNAKALPHFERAWKLRIEVLGERHADTLLSHANYALALHQAGQMREALPHFEQALTRSTQLLGERHPATLNTINSYAYALAEQGRTREALTHYQRAVQMRSEVLGETHIDTLTSLANYASTLQDLGRGAEALVHVERALNLSRETLGEKHPYTLSALNHYSRTLTALGRHAEALKQDEHVLRLRREVLGENHPNTLVSLSNYAYSLRALGRAPAALPHFERVYHAYRESHGETHATTLAARSNYASVLQDTGRAADALPHLEYVLKARTALLGEHHPDVLNSINNYAGVLRELGHRAQALPHYARALKLRSAVLGDKHPDTLTSLNNYASTLHAEGRAREALPYFERFLAGAEAQRDEAGEDSAESQRGTLGRFLFGYHNYLDALHDAGRPQDMLAVLERTKARTLLDQMTLRTAAAGSGLPEADARRLNDFAQRLGALDTRIAHAQNDAAREALRTERNAASRELAELKRALQGHFPRFRQITEVRLADTRDARLLLPPDSVFVSFVVTGTGAIKVLTLDANEQIRWFDIGVVGGLADTIEAARVWSANPGLVMRDDLGRRVQVLHWTQHKQPRWRVVTAGHPCSAEQIRADAQAVDPTNARGLDRPQSAIGNAGADCIPPGATVVSTRAQYQELINHVGQFLIEPLKAQLTGKTQVIISPDGPLALLPWDLLLYEGKPLVANFMVSQVQSLSVFKLLKERQTLYGKARGREALLAMGNPDYGHGGIAAARGADAPLLNSMLRNGASPIDTLRKIRWTNLPGTQVEMDQAAKIFAGRSRVISGRAASETTLRNLSSNGELTQYRYLLFAAHGYFDPNFPSYSSLVLTPEGAEPERDGYVTLGEWVGMNLRSELTVMSACNSARGENVGGEGLMGLAYALYVAGNINTLLTLWPVADEETAEFVASVLSKIKEGQSHAQAVTATKREFLNHANPRKRDPFFWAPFVLYGT